MHLSPPAAKGSAIDTARHPKESPCPILVREQRHIDQKASNGLHQEGLVIKNASRRAVVEQAKETRDHADRRPDGRPVFVAQNLQGFRNGLLEVMSHMIFSNARLGTLSTPKV